MYLGVDIGGTKTLVAVFDEGGTITEQIKFPTSATYKAFLTALQQNVAGLEVKQFTAAGVGVPGRLDRERGVAIKFGNLAWENVPIQADMQALFTCPVVIENDAKMAAFGVAQSFKDYRKVLYVTISTGIGYGLVVDGIIDTSVGDGGGRALLLEHEGREIAWEDFASGRAIFERYGKKASEITDAATWQTICTDLAQGLIELIAVMSPDVIVFGGGVGASFERFAEPLAAALQAHNQALVSLPVLKLAPHPEEAGVYGCYALAHQTYGNTASTR